MGIHLPVQPVQGIERNRPATAIEHRDARMTCALGATPHRRQVRHVLGEHQLGVPVPPILRGVVAARQPAQVAVERRDLIFLAHRLQARIEHHVGKIQAAPIKLVLVVSAQIEGQRPAIELVRAADERARFLHILEGLLRCQCLTDCFLRQVIQMCFERVLRCDHHRQAHGRVFGHLVEQRVDRIALAGLAGQVPRARRYAQPVGDQYAVRHPVEVPGALPRIGARLAKEQPLAEIPSARQFDLTGFGLIGVAGQRIEALPVFDAGPKQRGTRIEPPQQPVVDVGRRHAPRLDAGVRQPAAQAVADEVQHLLGRLAAAAGLSLSGHAAIDHHAHAPGLAAPAQPRDHGVLEQATRLGDRTQVMAEEAQVELGEGRIASARLHVVAQGLHVLVEAGLVLGVELEHPGVVIQLVERVLDRVLQSIAGVREPARFPALGAQRHQLVEGSHRLAILQQHGLRFGLELHPGQQFHERWRDVVQRLLVGHGSWPAALDRCARLGNAGTVQGLDMALPSVRLFVVTSAGSSQLRPGEFPAHQ